MTLAIGMIATYILVCSGIMFINLCRYKKTEEYKRVIRQIEEYRRRLNCTTDRMEQVRLGNAIRKLEGFL